jgi:O-antigen/teichoic acid export membrane protein
MIKTILSNSFYTGISRGFLTLANLFLIYFIGNFLHDWDLGTYTLVFFFSQLYDLLTEMGLSIFIGKEISRQNDKIKPIFNEFIIATLFGAGICLVLFAVSAVFYTKLNTSCHLLALLVGIFSGAERNLTGFLLGKEKMNIEALINGLVFIVLITSLLQLKSVIALPMVLLIRFATIFIGIIIRLFILLRKWVPFPGFSFTLLFYKESQFYWYMNFSAFIFRQIDLFLLSFYIGTVMLADYFLAVRIYIALGIIAEVFSFALTPTISCSFYHQSQKQFRHFCNKILGYSWLLGIGLGLGLFLAKDLILNIMSQHDTQQSSLYLLVFSFFIPIRVISLSLGALLSSSHYQKQRFIATVTTSIFFILLLIVGIWFFSVWGAVWAKVISELVLCLLYFYLVYFKMNSVKENDSHE